MKINRWNGKKIITSLEYPPIPLRQFDWSATFDDYDGSEDCYCPIGRGVTEEAAVHDLILHETERLAGKEDELGDTDSAYWNAYHQSFNHRDYR